MATEIDEDTSDVKVERRGILKNVGLGSVAATIAGTGKVKATHQSDCYEIAVYLTRTTYDETGDYTAQDYSNREISGVFENTDGECVVGFSPDDLISAPTQVAGRNNSFETNYPCDPTFSNIQYDNLLDWWESRATCPENSGRSLQEAADATLLLSGRDRNDEEIQGLGYAGQNSPDFSVADGGLWTTDWDGNYDRFTDFSSITPTERFQDGSVAVTAHEIGHNFQTDPRANDYDEHNVHDTIENNGNQYKTLMNVGYNNTNNNECGETLPDEDGWAHNYSDCATSLWHNSEYEGEDHCNLTTATVGKSPTKRSIKRFRYDAMPKSFIGRGLMKIYYNISSGPAETIRKYSNLWTSKGTKRIISKAGYLADKRNRNKSKSQTVMLSVIVTVVYSFAVLLSLIGHAYIKISKKGEPK